MSEQGAIFSLIMRTEMEKENILKTMSKLGDMLPDGFTDGRSLVKPDENSCDIHFNAGSIAILRMDIAPYKNRDGLFKITIYCNARKILAVLQYYRSIHKANFKQVMINFVLGAFIGTPIPHQENTPPALGERERVIAG